jgi:hypothetical protein
MTALCAKLRHLEETEETTVLTEKGGKEVKA